MRDSLNSKIIDFIKDDGAMTEIKDKNFMNNKELNT